MEEQDYQPIACALHDEYELAIMRKQPIKISWSDAHAIQYCETVLPKDLRVARGQEFLIAETDAGEEVCVRLDRVELLG